MYGVIVIVYISSIVIYLSTVRRLPKALLLSRLKRGKVRQECKVSSTKGISQHYAPLRTFVDINVIFLPFFFLLLVVGGAWLELLGSRLLAST